MEGKQSKKLEFLSENEKNIKRLKKVFTVLGFGLVHTV